MGKREKKIEVIRKYIDNVGGTTWPGYSYGKIPKTQALNACRAYAGAVQVQDILGLVDITVTENGKKGIVFTEYKAYYDNGFMAERGSISYRSIHENGTIPGGIFCSAYNKQALIELLSMLAQVEGTDIGDTVNDTIDELTQGVQTVAETVDKAVNLFKNIASLFDSDEE